MLLLNESAYLTGYGNKILIYSWYINNENILKTLNKFSKVN